MTKRRALISITLLDHDRVRIGEARFALDHAHAERGKALPRIVRRDGRDDAMDVIDARR